MAASPAIPQTLTLPDGRKLDYLVSGPADGFPLVYLHGTPGGAYPPGAAVLGPCEERNIKLITISRAGYGGSTRVKGRRIVDVVPDVQAVLGHLGIDKCVVGGESGGGPHALACAARLPGCLAALSIASLAPYDAEGLDFLAGQGESNIEEYEATLQGEEAIQKLCTTMRSSMLSANLDDIIKELSTVLPEVDKNAMLDDPDVGDEIVESFRASLRVSADGWVDDDVAFVHPWGFDVSKDIKIPVGLWQGDLDKMVPVAHGKWLAAHLPQDQVQAHLLHGEGHVSIRKHMGEMLDELLKNAEAGMMKVWDEMGV